jgi:hypothetical protein
MKLVVSFDVDNDVFGEPGSPESQREVSRILGRVAEKALFVSAQEGKLAILDSNGNRVGEWGWETT